MACQENVNEIASFFRAKPGPISHIPSLEMPGNGLGMQAPVAFSPAVRTSKRWDAKKSAAPREEAPPGSARP